MHKVALLVAKTDWVNLLMICEQHDLVPPSTFYHSKKQLEEKTFKHFFYKKQLMDLEKEIEHIKIKKQ
jgi:hypothetical protein